MDSLESFVGREIYVYLPSLINLKESANTPIGAILRRVDAGGLWLDMPQFTAKVFASLNEKPKEEGAAPVLFVPWPQIQAFFVWALPEPSDPESSPPKLRPI